MEAALRPLYCHRAIYTFWDCFRNAYAADRRRIGYVLLNPPLAPLARKSTVAREVRS